MLIICADCILGQWDTADPLLGSADTGPDDTAKGRTIQPLHTRLLPGFWCICAKFCLFDL